MSSKSAKFDPTAKAPISTHLRNQLTIDSKKIKVTANRKKLSLNNYEEIREESMARDHFELGCWLHHYHNKVGLDTQEGFDARVDCALRLFLSGIHNPRYDFFTVFDFGERQFDTIFEMGDADAVIAKLRSYIPSDSTGLIAKTFGLFQWPL